MEFKGRTMIAACHEEVALARSIPGLQGQCEVPEGLGSQFWAAGLIGIAILLLIVFSLVL
jgi:hypothetical protein